MATFASIELGSSSVKKPRTGSLNQAQIKWRTGAQERIYNRRLIEALRATRAATTPGPHAVKEAADSALAITARGQSRWSRAILTSRLRRRKLLTAAKAGSSGCEGGKVGERLRALGKLVPGCRRLPAPTLLEEAADYVAALQMQVKTMRALADALSAATITSPSPAPAMEEDS
ncbi:Retrovirus capsid N-terminal protein [Dioscorea alata]|uniref:Retrovirus capsid N-terminal protein n=1 Tax=Dioscorea alata TaxID=55571 RepID=A0ACB7UDP1_DIOAL|nr:Retrovirus capsid N-terminal protein [Dioscorea alata]